MKDLELKQKVLQEIMGLMDEKEGDSLKSHPKLMAAKVEVAKPEMSEEESPVEEALEAKSPVLESKEGGESELSQEDLQKLLEHFKDLA